MVSFALSPTQKALREHVRAFASQHLAGAYAAYSTLPTQSARFQATQPYYEAAVKAGLIKGLIPIPAGGSSEGVLDLAIAVEEYYAVDTCVPLTLAGTALGLLPIILTGAQTPVAKAVLGQFLKEEGAPIASLCHSEPGGTANWLEIGAKGLGVTAREEEDAWVIDGEKLWTTNAGGWDYRGATVQCVCCRDSSIVSPNPRDSAMILMVTRDVIAANPPSAYEILGEPSIIGHTAVSGPHARYTGLRVPKDHMLCPPGTAADIITAAFTLTAALVGAMGVGMMRKAFTAALGYAKKETRGGTVPILQRQSVADLLIDVKMKMETARYLTWKACEYVSTTTPEIAPGQRAELALMAKVYSSEAAVTSVVDCMKVVGVSSYSTAMPFGQLLNDAVCLPIFDGGNVGIRRRQIQNLFLQDSYDPENAPYL